MLAGMLEGLRYARGRPEIRGVLLVALVHFSFGMVYMQVFAPLFAVDVLDIGSGGNPSQALTTLDGAIDTISSMRGLFGAAQNRLQTTIQNLRILEESLSASESRIRDVDLAVETAELTKQTIMQQAAVSVLAQANVQQQVALSLLR